MKAFDKTVYWTLLVLACFTSIFLMFLTVSFTISDGKIDYCYIKYINPYDGLPQYQLFGHRNYKSDRFIAPFMTLSAAKEAADLIQCPIK